MTTEALELQSFFELPNLDHETIERYADSAHVSFAARDRFDTLLREYVQRVEEGSGDPLRLAIGLALIGRHSSALERFERAPADKLRHWYAAHSAAALRRYDAALAELDQARQQGWDTLTADLRSAELLIQAGRLDDARALVDKHQPAGPDRAAWWHVSGLLHEAGGARESALEAYNKALLLDEQFIPAMFCAARLCDQFGDDDRALDLYEMLTEQPRAHINALINAAVIYEDIGRYNDALGCLRRVLKAYPNHERARLFLKDVESCREMIVDDTTEERTDARSRLLDTPLSEFELSVRARNCLKKMNIRTLGELIQLSEVELLAYKNFGETSLAEIKQLLDKKGLRLGQQPEEVQVAESEVQDTPKPAPVPPGQEAILARSVSELELSVRARRCLQRLNIQNLGDLVNYTEQDLLATRNFGVTSLNEIKARLAELGLQLSPRKPG